MITWLGLRSGEGGRLGGGWIGSVANVHASGELAGYFGGKVAFGEGNFSLDWGVVAVAVGVSQRHPCAVRMVQRRAGRVGSEGESTTEMKLKVHFGFLCLDLTVEMGISPYGLV